MCLKEFDTPLCVPIEKECVCICGDIAKFDPPVRFNRLIRVLLYNYLPLIKYLLFLSLSCPILWWVSQSHTAALAAFWNARNFFCCCSSSLLSGKGGVGRKSRKKYIFRVFLPPPLPASLLNRQTEPPTPVKFGRARERLLLGTIG